MTERALKLLSEIDSQAWTKIYRRLAKLPTSVPRLIIRIPTLCSTGWKRCIQFLRNYSLINNKKDLDWSKYHLKHWSLFKEQIALINHSCLDCGRRPGGEFDEAAEERWCGLRDTASTDNQLQGGCVSIESPFLCWRIFHLFLFILSGIAPFLTFRSGWPAWTYSSW